MTLIVDKQNETALVGKFYTEVMRYGNYLARHKE